MLLKLQIATVASSWITSLRLARVYRIRQRQYFTMKSRRQLLTLLMPASKRLTRSEM